LWIILAEKKRKLKTKPNPNPNPISLTLITCLYVSQLRMYYNAISPDVIGTPKLHTVLPVDIHAYRKIGVGD